MLRKVAAERCCREQLGKVSEGCRILLPILWDAIHNYQFIGREQSVSEKDCPEKRDHALVYLLRINVM